MSTQTFANDIDPPPSVPFHPLPDSSIRTGAADDSHVAPPTGLEPSSGAGELALLFGRDERGRPHGARFDGGDLGAIRRAAELMALTCIVADTDALRSLGAELPAGRLFASGRAFAPFVRGELYDRLLAATGTPDAPKPAKASGKPAEAGAGAGAGKGGGGGGSGAGDPPASRFGAKAPATFADIGLGSHVLAEDVEEGGYWLAEVIATQARDHFVLRWVDFADLPEFSRPRRALALLYSGAGEKG